MFYYKQRASAGLLISESINISKQATGIANGGFSRVSGEAELEKANAAMITYGSLFISNPDLPKRFERNAPLNEPDRATMYGGQDQGYIAYPFLDEDKIL